VKYIPRDVSEEEIAKVFSEAGNIISMKIN
jgi:hypothetical protein